MMPIANSSVLKGRPTAGKVVSGSSAHYDITVQANTGMYTVAVNIESVDGSEVLYAIQSNFTPPDTGALKALAEGVTPLASKPGGLALDFVRETINGSPMITRGAMTLLPIATSSSAFLTDERANTENPGEARAHALQNAVVALLNQAVADGDATVYAFGSAYADSGVVDGIHDIHMNQGNPAGNHGGDNGIWQDGALFLSLPGQGTWTAVFLAFQTENWNTNDNGDPVSS
jgi:uncharacterized protein YukJ